MLTSSLAEQIGCWDLWCALSSWFEWEDSSRQILFWKCYINSWLLVNHLWRSCKMPFGQNRKIQHNMFMWLPSKICSSRMSISLVHYNFLKPLKIGRLSRGMLQYYVRFIFKISAGNVDTAPRKRFSLTASSQSYEEPGVPCLGGMCRNGYAWVVFAGSALL